VTHHHPIAHPHSKSGNKALKNTHLDMPTTIKFTIAQDGTVTEEVQGVKGTKCESLTKNIEERLGEVENRIHTPSFYQKVEDEIEEFTHDSEGC
tara:strand:+ start:16 stop:297 length:282 start_codon:yes stop_codon:yes gene_type:complete